MTVVLMSDGLPVPVWEEYLPYTHALYFKGEHRQEEVITAYLRKKHIVHCADVRHRLKTVLAFWNGTPHFVDHALSSFTCANTHIFLPTEDGFGFEEYIPQI